MTQIIKKAVLDKELKLINNKRSKILNKIKRLTKTSKQKTITKDRIELALPKPKISHHTSDIECTRIKDDSNKLEKIKINWHNEDAKAINCNQSLTSHINYCTTIYHTKNETEYKNNYNNKTISNGNSQIEIEIQIKAKHAYGLADI